MEDLIWGIIGIIIAVCAGAYMISLIWLMLKGQLVQAEVTEVREKKDRKGVTVSYIHRLKFEYGGKVYENDDRAGFSLPFAAGDKKLIRFNSGKPSKFEYEDEIKKNIIISGILVVLAIVFALSRLVM